jgi:hypothetical protein
MPDSNELSARTDDVAQRIEHMLGVKWTPDQYRKVVSILRFYRHQSLKEFMDRIAEEGRPTGEGSSGQ